MPYLVSYRGLDGQAGLKAHVQRMDDLMFWDESSDIWVTSESGACDIALTEGATPGSYSASASFNAAHGVTYAVSILDGSGNLIVRTLQPYVSDKKTALEIVNEVQASLRMPQSADFSYPHAKLVLAQINNAIEMMVEECEWPESNLLGSFMTKAGVSIYAVRPIGASQVEIIKRLQISDHAPLVRRTDQAFRQLVAQRAGTQNEPTDYRIYSRAGGVIVIEVSPVPDAAHQVDFDLLLRASILSATTDIPLLDVATIILGGTAFAKKEQGMAFEADMGMFQAKLQMQEGNQTEPNWGDAECV